MTRLKTLLGAAGLGLCVVAFSGTALADPGNGNGGPPATPPGQEKKAEQPAPVPAAAPAPAPQAAAPGQEKKAEKQEAKAEKKAESTPPGQAKKAEKQADKPAQSAKPSKGQSANAHHHVVICHRTGSLKNPYVVINIPYTAWLHAHSDTTGSHPDLNGNHDIMLKDPASRPGSKDGFSKSACGATATPLVPAVTPSTQPAQQTGACPATTTTTERVLVGVWHATGSYKNGVRKYVYITPSLGSAHYTKHADDKPVYEQRTVTTTASAETCASGTPPANSVTPPTQPSNPVTPEQPQPIVPTPLGQTPAPGTVGVLPAATPAPASGVAGAVSPANAAAAAKNAAAAAKKDKRSGVLGAVASAPEAIAETATRGTLPFTGFPLWMAVLIGGTLLAGGLVLRRTA